MRQRLRRGCAKQLGEDAVDSCRRDAPVKVWSNSLPSISTLPRWRDYERLLRLLHASTVVFNTARAGSAAQAPRAQHKRLRQRCSPRVRPEPAHPAAWCEPHPRRICGDPYRARSRRRALTAQQPRRPPRHTGRPEPNGARVDHSGRASGNNLAQAAATFQQVATEVALEAEPRASAS